MNNYLTKLIRMFQTGNFDELDELSIARLSYLYMLMKDNINCYSKVIKSIIELDNNENNNSVKKVKLVYPILFNEKYEIQS